jgi:hypothetical protein
MSYCLIARKGYRGLAAKVLALPQVHGVINYKYIVFPADAKSCKNPIIPHNQDASERVFGYAAYGMKIDPRSHS